MVHSPSLYIFLKGDGSLITSAFCILKRRIPLEEEYSAFSECTTKNTNLVNMRPFYYICLHFVELLDE
jgi:hypothetical protein